MYKLPLLAVILTALLAVSPAAAHPRVDTLELPAVGRVTTTGEVTEHVVPGANPLPGTIVAGLDGALYLAERNDNVATPRCPRSRPRGSAR